MRIAIIGSRNLRVDISKYMPKNVNITEIISGGAIGIDSLAERYADTHNIPKLILLPDYRKFGALAPLIRNTIIVDMSNMIIAIWNGRSPGTKYTIDYAKRNGKDVRVYII